jgi:alkylation response protein AidB-like acyl-CoA dehydrogenase
VDFDMPPEDDPRRVAVREWLAAHPQPTGRQLAEAGYVVPHWPPPYGLGADPIHQLVIDEELKRAAVGRPAGIGVGWAAPTIALAGTAEQQERYLMPALSGEESWCQLFSEPEAGSDLASLRTFAERDGDDYVVSGSKIWTSLAHLAAFGILLARTSRDVPKHRGISYFICPMDSPGISMSPIIDMTGAHSFNEVFFDEVRIPSSLRVGEEGDGWRLARITLGNERVSLSSGGSLWGAGPSAEDLVRLLRESGGVSDAVLRQKLAALYSEGEILRLVRARTVTSAITGREPGPVASIQKLLSDEHGQHVMELAKELAGTSGMLAGSGPPGSLGAAPGRRSTPTEMVAGSSRGVEPVWHYGFLFSPALTLGGGTWAVQRNIVAERALGLPREVDLSRSDP